MSSSSSSSNHHIYTSNFTIYNDSDDTTFTIESNNYMNTFTTDTSGNLIIDSSNNITIITPKTLNVFADIDASGQDISCNVLNYNFLNPPILPVGPTGISYLSTNSSTLTWNWNLTTLISNPINNIPFSLLLATNVPSLASQVYTGDYTFIPQQLYFTINSPVLKNTTTNPTFTNPSVQQMPDLLTDLYANGINVIQMSGTSNSPTDFLVANPFGAVFNDNTSTSTVTNITPFQPTFTGIASLTTTTLWYGSYYLVQTSYNFASNNIGNGYSISIFFNEPTYSGGIPTTMADFNIIVQTNVGVTPFANNVNLQLNLFI